MVHSVDRPALVSALDDARSRLDVPALDVLLQVNLDPAAISQTVSPTHRGGALPAEVPALADAVAAATSLRLRGVMAVAPLDAAGADLDRAFDLLAGVSATLRRAHSDANLISAGMSGDLESAIMHGATHVRVGSSVLGMRTSLL
jgi:hypothetical protein